MITFSLPPLRDNVARESNNSHLVVFNHILRTVLQRSNGCLTIGNQVRHMTMGCKNVTAVYCIIMPTTARSFAQKTEQDAKNA